jgi:integrase
MGIRLARQRCECEACAADRALCPSHHEGMRLRLHRRFVCIRVQHFLAALRDRRPLPPLDPAITEYTKKVLAELLGIKPPALTTLVSRHRLATTGKGKARRYPKETAEALSALRTRGRSIKTSNLYLDSVKQFATWLVQDRRMAENPLTHLAGGNVKLDRRHDRRSIPLQDLRTVIRAASQSDRSFRGLTGADRSVLYAVACASGFRAEELASLWPTAFDLDGDPPTVTLAAEHAKNGRTAVQPLQPDIVETLRGYLADRADDRPIWAGTWFTKAAEMLRIELDACGIPYAIDGPDGLLYADFHSLRHSYIGLLDRSGATLKEAMQLARHSDPKLTMAVYGRAQLHDLGEAVRRLPPLVDVEASVPKSAAATGTDPVPSSKFDHGPISVPGQHALAAVDGPVCTGFAQKIDIQRERMSLVDAATNGQGEKRAGRKPSIAQGLEAGCDLVRASEASSPSFDCSSSTLSDSLILY